MHTAFKYRLYPTEKQAEILENWFGCNRFIWNWALTENKLEYEYKRQFMFRFNLQSYLPELKQKYEWLAKVPSQALQCKIQDFDRALTAVWEKGNGFPKYQNKKRNNSVRIPQTNGHIHPTKKQIKIPKIGWVDWAKHRPLQGKLKSITIKREGIEYYVSCLCEVPDVQQYQDISEMDIVGIDLGLMDFAITSDGECFDTQRFYRKKQQQLKKKQRVVARKTKGSKRRLKAVKQLQKIHAKIRHQREDFTHQSSAAITKQYQVVGIEDLHIAGMIKNRRLAKSIADQGWRMYMDQLAYKSTRNGGFTVKIDRFAPSSKTCSSCGHKQDMPLDVRVYECERCGDKLCRDLNAAINIRNWTIVEINRWGTHRIYARGGQNYPTDEARKIPSDQLDGSPLPLGCG